ncbi:uncharacterized protein LOC108114151 [Drosophila eugracilis]|uniref:uncharacterized protein LOC108114151 n=1 Tax=Drosophila eugracilis TaxID=29029 RepID=UPI0007E78D7F|nr:uncharacterized protein LOC108114151 [Drosophila eugracilis]
MGTAKKEKPEVKKKSPEKGKQQKAKAVPVQPPPVVKQRTVVTPWRDTLEFNETYDFLFGKTSTTASRRQALSKIRIWSLRRGNLCPAAVLATSVLVEAQLDDKEGNFKIQQAYASAFTRFYNFMSSIIQGYNMSSMYETAKELGLQSFIVDLRHLCAHGQELPPVEVLRSTSDHCLDWLRTYYWLPHKETMSNLDAGKLKRKDKLKFEKAVSALLEIYDLTLECHFKGAEKLKAISKLKSSSEFNKIRVYSSAKKAKTAKEILNAVVTDLSALIKRESSSMKDLLDIYTGCLLKMEYFLGVGLEIDDNEDILIAATQGLFRLLAVQGYIEKVFVALVQLTENENEPEERRLGAGYWASKMIESFGMLLRMKRMYKEELDLNDKLKAVDFASLNTDKISKTLRSLLVHSNVDPSTTLIFGDNPKKSRSLVFEREFIMQRVAPFSKYSAPILKGLLPLADPPFSKVQLESLGELCDVRLQGLTQDEPMEEESSSKQCSSSEEDSSSDEIYDLDYLEKLVATASQNKDNSFNKAHTSDLGIWKLESDNDWSKSALGVLPYGQ